MQQSNDDVQTAGQQIATSAPGNKEHEPASASGEKKREVQVSEVPKEIEAGESSSAQQKIDTPPDLSALTSPAPQSVPQQQAQPAAPQVDLPLSDTQVMKGLHEDVTNPVTWLAYWCIKQLKKAHLILKVVHGSVVRVTEKAH